MKSLLLRLPGLLSWAFLITPLFLVFTWPELAAVFFLIFSLFWLYRSLSYSFFLLKSYVQYRIYDVLPWSTMLQSGEAKAEHIVGKQLSHHRLKGPKNTPLQAEDIVHSIIIATYKEPFHVLKDTLDSIIKSDFNLKQVIIVMATEERDALQGYKNAIRLKAHFGHHFKAMLISVHPKNIEGEVIGKGGNITYAARTLTSYLKKHGELQHPERHMVTTLDADNMLHRNYLNILSYTYIHTPHRLQHSYQPLPFLCNNIWNVPIFIRIVAVSATFWHFIESGRTDTLRNFSSHAQPLKSLIGMDYWSTSTIVEDGHQFWRSYMHHKGQYSVVPLFVPIYQDAVQHDSYLSTLVAQYKQLRRWAQGAEDIAYTMIEFTKAKADLPKRKSFFLFLHLLEGHLMWATAPLLLTVTTLLFQSFNPNFTSTTLYYNFGFLLSTIFTVALVGIFISMSMSLIVIPKPPHTMDWHKRVYYRTSLLFQWILLPITTILLAAVPALDAQTRLMVGKQMFFNVTKKVRHPSA